MSDAKGAWGVVARAEGKDMALAGAGQAVELTVGKAHGCFGFGVGRVTC